MVHMKLAGVLALSGLATAAPGWKEGIKNVVILVQENRSFDTIAGGLDYNPDIDGLLHHNYCNAMNVSDPNSVADVCAGPLGGDVNKDDPNHSISGVNMQLFSTFHPNEAEVSENPAWKFQNMRGFVTEHSISFKTTEKERVAQCINYYPPEHIPVLASLSKNFLLFDRWFCSVPGPTNPNRAYITSGTSAGHGKNDNDFNVFNLTQKSIFQQLSEKGISWINYQNSTIAPGQGFNPDAAFYKWTKDSGADKTNIKPLTQFYKDAEAGVLPALTYINPECCDFQSMHPPSPISMGEEFIKGIYESLRSSPQWNSTLFILTFDEHGGFGDHVPPPVGVPSGDNKTYTEKAKDGADIGFDFTRLGPRVPTWLIGPWVGKGHVEHAGRNFGGEYSHTSILATLSELWGIEKLTPRVEWSATFEHLFLDKPRRECSSPVKLPNPVPW